MFGIGMPEMCIIMGIVLIVFGPGKLPQLGQALGSSLKNFKKAATEEPVKLPEQQD